MGIFTLDADCEPAMASPQFEEALGVPSISGQWPARIHRIAEALSVDAEAYGALGVAGRAGTTSARTVFPAPSSGSPAASIRPHPVCRGGRPGG